MPRCRRCEPIPEEVRRTADLLERRYALSIIYASAAGAVRFNEFRQALGPIPPTTLAARLTDLADAGILERHILDTHPPRSEYHLTNKGRKLGALLNTLLTHNQPGSAPPHGQQALTIPRA
jgi:DNA-binding HxlR family transcriptional regulator